MLASGANGRALTLTPQRRGDAMELGKIEAIESKEVTLPGLYRVTWGQGARSEVVVADSPDNALRKIVPRASVTSERSVASRRFSPIRCPSPAAKPAFAQHRGDDAPEDPNDD